MAWETPVRFLKGVGERRAALLGRLGVKTLEDLLFYLPWRYEDRAQMLRIDQLRPDGEVTFRARIHACRLYDTPRKRMQIFEALVTDGSGWLSIKWFNQPYLKKILKKDLRFVFYGRVRINPYEGRPELENPQFERLGAGEADRIGEPEDELIHSGRIVPIYHETRGMSSRWVRSAMKRILDDWAGRIGEVLPEPILKRQGLYPLEAALKEIHFPPSESDCESLNRGTSAPHRRLIFDDFFLLQLALACSRRELTQRSEGLAFDTQGPCLSRFLASLPFSLTGAQRRVLREISDDMSRPRPMNRLLQGDVGCGKTLVACAGLLIAIQSGHQGALMAPTEILAEQHFLTLRRWLQPLGIRCVLLTSGMGRGERLQALGQIRSGEAKLAVGTHALVQEGVCFSSLGMVVIDEQHKFGVVQRGSLARKGARPDVLIMTATPIPRTLALSVYGDMDVSVIDEMPPGRTPVRTLLFEEAQRSKGYELVSRELRAGRQVYVVYPLVEESEKTDLKAASQMADHLAKDVFPEWRVGLLHGRMKSDEKEAIMALFKSRQIDLLVSTTVIEVGIDVPNATVMMVEHAERFGLSQLHQLRGRVGRGGHLSICLLMPGKRIGVEGRRRLEVMTRHTDGFAIAEQDLVIRGPGDFFGTRQSGLPELKAANLIRDARILEMARREAFALVEKDPSLSLPEHREIRDLLRRRWKDRLDLGTIA